MKQTLCWLFFLLILQACEKSTEVLTNEENSTLSTNNGNSNTIRLKYADSIFYLNSIVANNLHLPVAVPNVNGYFKAIPQGLTIDSLTGRINVYTSITGLRYKIFYISQSNNLPVDSTKIVLSGVDYKDGIYNIAQTVNTYDTSFPIYNANPSLALPCSEDDDDDSNSCVFDETDLNGDGNDDINGVIQDKLLINEKIGTIDLEASFHAGVFGSGNPANGVTKNFTFYYRLNDLSNRALQKISVRLIHYKKVTDIPQSVLNELNNRNSYQNEINSRAIIQRPTRPPLIIIVSNQ